MIGQRLLRAAHLVMSLLFAALALTVLGIALGARLAPTVGYELFSIRSGSMEPSLPVGSLTVVSTPAGKITTGDAVAFQLPNGTVVTHRVVEVVDTPDGRFLRTRGDANEKPDPALVPAGAVVGPVRASVPLLGIVLALLGMPIGVVTILAVAGSLLTAIWLVEELQVEDEVADPLARRWSTADRRIVHRQRFRRFSPGER